MRAEDDAADGGHEQDVGAPRDVGAEGARGRRPTARLLSHGAGHETGHGPRGPHAHAETHTPRAHARALDRVPGEDPARDLLRDPHLLVTVFGWAAVTLWLFA